MHGFYGRILDIDLSAGTFEIQTLDETVCRDYLGGKGLATYLLYTRNPAGVDPLAPENHLVFATGPVTRSLVWGSSRYGVFTKSPQTGFYSESYSGGKTPEAMDAAGFDAVVLHGAAESPTVLAIGPNGVIFHGADDIWGMDTYRAEDAVLDRFAAKTGYPKKGAVVIGPAGEQKIAFSVIENDYWRSAGRTGAGAVMGAKKVKALVFFGDRKRPLYAPDAIKGFSRNLAADAKESPVVEAYKTKGTPMMVKIINTAGAFPTRYWSDSTCGHWEKISAEALNTRCDVTPRACARCLMACGRLSTVKTGRHAGLTIEGPEYETLYAFGGLCMIDSIEEICHLNDICDRLGMDTITAGNLCAFTIEAVRRGRVQFEIDYGDADGIARLLEQIGRREGIGDLLARGIRVAARDWDLTDIAVHTKGLEPAGYDPRVLKGMGLSYAVSDRGACHLRATFYKPEVSGMIPPGQIEGKAELFLDFEDRLTLFDTLILCRFYRDFYQWEELGDILHGLTGLPGDKDTLRRLAANVTDIVRRFNLREGLTPADDCLPEAFHRALKKTGQVIEKAELAHMVQDYYRLRGWDEKGRPPEGQE